jgi:PBP1b-binding outer membrane lipoprotein LpoB
VTYKPVIHAILVSAVLVVGCQREAAGPPAAAPAPAQSDSGSDDKTRIQLNLGKQGSIDIERKD